MADRIRTDIERLIGRVYADRGLAYARQGKVLDIDVDDTLRRVSGSVRASDGGAYGQQIVLDWSPAGRITAIRGTCSCPVGENCKHVAALLHTALPQLAGHSARTGPDLSTALSGVAQVWLKAAPAADRVGQDDYPPQIHDRIIYVLSRRNDRLVVQPWKGRINKDGELGKSLSRYDFPNMASSTPPKFLRPVDLRIRRLLGLSVWLGGTGGWPLPEAEEGSRTLALILSTGRARWEEAKDPVLFAGPERQGEFVWQADATGRQALRVETAHGQVLTPLPVEPLWYLEEANGACGPLATDLAPSRSAWLATAPAVSPAEVAGMAAALQRLPGPALPLPRVIGQTLRRDVPPRPVIHLHGIQAQAILPYDWRRPALLHKSSDGRSSPFPRQTYPTTSVTGMPRAVKPFRTATRTWNSAT